MLVVHHLNESRSQRILWLLEELGAPYEIAFHQRDAETRLAPPELVAIHPLGKSPVIVDDGQVVHESGAIIDYIIRKHGGRLAPAPGTTEHEAYLQWLHYAEGSAMLPLMLLMYVMRLGEAGAPLHPRIESEIANHLGFVDGALAGAAWELSHGEGAATITLTLDLSGARSGLVLALLSSSLGIGNGAGVRNGTSSGIKGITSAAPRAVPDPQCIQGRASRAGVARAPRRRERTFP